MKLCTLGFLLLVMVLSWHILSAQNVPESSGAQKTEKGCCEFCLGEAG